MITQRIIIRSIPLPPPLSCYKPINRYSFINNSRPRKNAIIQRNASKRACVSSVSRRVLKNSPDILISPRDCIPTSEPRGKRRRLAGAKGEPADIRFHPFPSFLLFSLLLLLSFFFLSISQFSSRPRQNQERTIFELASKIQKRYLRKRRSAGYICARETAGKVTTGMIRNDWEWFKKIIILELLVADFDFKLCVNILVGIDFARFMIEEMEIERNSKSIQIEM